MLINSELNSGKNNLHKTITSEHKYVNEAAMITLLITASPISLCGLNSVIWGLIGGLFVLFINTLKLTK